MSDWIPDMAEPEIEAKMEALDIPEEDRDEVRRFAEFLAFRAARKRGEAVAITAQMKNWLMGLPPSE